jgi:hypothetical protein
MWMCQEVTHSWRRCAASIYFQAKCKKYPWEPASLERQRRRRAEIPSSSLRCTRGTKVTIQ